MAKTQKELAYLRDLYIDEQWTQRFTDLVDKHIKFSKEKNLLYINASTGNHVFALRDKYSKVDAMFATCENEDILKIARDKAIAVQTDVDFSMLQFEDEAFDAVLADASFVRPADLKAFVENSVRVARPGATIANFLVTSGSFGEVFSILWEVLFNEGMGDNGHVTEELITELPTVEEVEEMAGDAGLSNIESHTAIEVFEYENGAEFVSSPLVADFLLPVWLKTLSEKEKKQATKKLAKLVDDEDGPLTFRFSVKATLVTGQKAFTN